MCYRMRIPKGGAYLPAIRPGYLEERIDTLGSCKEREMLLAAYHRRRGMAITDISVEMRRPRTTIRGWLARAMERGPDDLSDRKAPGRRTLLDEPSRWWLSELLGRGPGGCGFQAGSWQSGTILELIRREFGISCSPRTLRRMLHKIRFSYRKPRPVPYNSAPEAEQGEFKRRTSAEVGRLTGHGYAVFSEDEALRRLSAAAGYGWFPTNGNETVPTGFSTRCVRMFGILGKDGHHVQTAEATNSRTFVDFLKWVRLKYPKFVLVLDNASYHKSGTVMDYLAYVNGDIRLVFLPPYTPQLNPTEILWREIKRPLSCRYFESEEDLERAIMEIVGGGELKYVKTMDYLAA